MNQRVSTIIRDITPQTKEGFSSDTTFTICNDFKPFGYDKTEKKIAAFKKKLETPAGNLLHPILYIEEKTIDVKWHAKASTDSQMFSCDNGGFCITGELFSGRRRVDMMLIRSAAMELKKHNSEDKKVMIKRTQLPHSLWISTD